MKNSKISFCLIILFTIVLSSISIISYAANYSISSGISTIEVGKTYNVKISAPGLTGRFNVSHSSNVSVSCSSVWVENGVAEASIKVTANSAGKATVTVSPESVANASTGEVLNLSAKTDTVTIKAKSTSSTTNKPSTSTSSGSTTKAPTFTSVNETVYAKSDVNIRASYSTSSSILGSLKKGASIKRTGKSSEWSKVTYNGRTAYISSSFLTTTKPKEEKTDEQKSEEKKSDNKNLKSLTVSPMDLTPDFVTSTTEYTMTVGVDVNEIEVNAIAEDEKAKVEIKGNKDLKVGKNTITIKVTAEDNTTKTYKILVTKEEKEHLKLNELLIEGLPLEPEFNKDIYEYTISLDRNDITELNITATPNKKDANIEIVGNSDLKIGSNVITILIKSADGKETATYQITANIPETVVGKTTSSIDKETLMYIGIGVGIALVIIVVIIVIAKYRKKEDEYSTYYGAYNFKNDDEDVLDNSAQKKKQKMEDNNEEEEEELPKFLRRNKEIKNEETTENNILEKNDMLEKNNVLEKNDILEIRNDMEKKRIEMKKKIDELYGSNADNDLASKRGKHF